MRECRRGERRLLANLAALYFRLSFILPTDFLCISFRSFRAANMQKCCKRRLRKRGRKGGRESEIESERQRKQATAARPWHTFRGPFVS